MPAITLYPGTVAGIPGTGLGSVVGSGSVWHDASDSTYLDSQGNLGTGEYTARAPLDTLTLPPGATVTSVVANIRVQALGTSATPARVGAVIRDSTHTNDYAVGDDLGSGHTGGWTVPTTGSILDLSLTIDQAMIAFNGPPGATVADLVTQLETAGVDLDIRALDLSGSPAAIVRLRIYEFSVDVNYDDAIDLPCDTWVDLDLSTAVILNPLGGDSSPYGQYSDGVIWTVPDEPSPGLNGFPDFYFPGLVLDETKRYRIEVTYDPGSSHDAGGRGVWLTGITAGDEESSYASGPWDFGDLADLASNTDDVVTFVVQAAGSGLNIWFESDNEGAVSAVRIRKICRTVTPPLQQYPRTDGLAASSVRLHWPDPNSIQRGIQRGPSATQ